MESSQVPSFDYSERLRVLRDRNSTNRLNEAYVNQNMVKPVLENVLGYQPEDIYPELTDGLKRPDFICYTEDDVVDLIVEGKDLTTDLDKRPVISDPATRIPKFQLEQYLRRHAGSRDGVFGLLSNGNEWRVCQRVEDDIVWHTGGIAETNDELREILQPLLVRDALKPVDTDEYVLALDWLKYIRTYTNPAELLTKINPTESKIHQNGTNVYSVEVSSSMGSYVVPSKVFLATIRSLGDDGIISIADILNALKGTHLIAPGETVVGVATAPVTESNRSVCVSCRVFAWDSERLLTSASFDPELPGRRVLMQLRELAAWKQGKPTALIKSLDVRSVQKEFYDDLATWFDRTGSTLRDLRHLVRILFTWFLKEHGYIPHELFDEHAEVRVHDQLIHLFTQTLSVRKSDREIPSNLGALKAAFSSTPFINGSLFTDEKSSQRSFLTDSHYVGTDPNKPGLLTILKRYDWTLTEHGDLHSDTALDPSMLGSVFERFVAVAENIQPNLLARQPLGTYYTPKDLTEEMVTDALAQALHVRLPHLQFEAIFELIHPKERSKFRIQDFSTQQKREIQENLRALSILDPCTGSGEFIVGVLNGLRRAERRLLGEDYKDQKRILHAIQHQLFAVDVHPIAVQITRLRFYLSLVDTKRVHTDTSSLAPLPNLETRITIANSLHTRIETSGDGILPTLFEDEFFRRWRNVWEEFMFTYSSSEKKRLRRKEHQLRKRISQRLDLETPEVRDWFGHDPLGKDDLAPPIGIPYVFGKISWDIVIGNPPYQLPDSTQKNTAKSNGYKTFKSGDLYALFVELGVSLLGIHGVLTMVVPHSICFARQKQTLREVCERSSSEILIRTYDNRPSPVFPNHPFIKGGAQAAQSRQRVSVVSLLSSSKSTSETRISSSCYIGIPAEERLDVLQSRPSYPQPPSANGQWTMAGSPHLVELLEVMQKGQVDIHLRKSSVAKAEITYPRTAYQFLTCLPGGALTNRRRRSIYVKRDELYWCRLCLYNSLPFLGFWLMIGDAFDVTPPLFERVALPRAWRENETERNKATKVARELCSNENIAKSLVVFRQNGREFPNCNFRKFSPDLIEESSLLTIRAYGLQSQENQIMSDLENLRDRHTWSIQGHRIN